jgi:hypothetical protein
MERLKAPKLACRGLVVWRCAGLLCGFDCRVASDNAFKASISGANCDSLAKSQFLNGFLRVRQDLQFTRPAAPGRRRGRGTKLTNTEIATPMPTARARSISIGPPIDLEAWSTLTRDASSHYKGPDCWNVMEEGHNDDCPGCDSCWPLPRPECSRNSNSTQLVAVSIRPQNYQ